MLHSHLLQLQPDAASASSWRKFQRRKELEILDTNSDPPTPLIPAGFKTQLIACRQTVCTCLLQGLKPIVLVGS